MARFGRANQKEQSEKLQRSQADPGSDKDKRPAFAFENLCRGNSHSLKSCNREHKAALVDTLDKLSQLTWNQIRATGRHQLGHEIISQDSVKMQMPTCITPDVTLLAFRFKGNAPMVGYKDGHIFYVVWLDPDFSLYDHG